jgi:hypothetical protein
MKSSKRINNRWVVASDRQIKAAEKKGLYKRLTSLPAKKSLKLSLTHISRLAWMVGDVIERRRLMWHESGGGTDDDQKAHFYSIELLLYLLEDLFSYYLQTKQIELRDGRKIYSFNHGDSGLFEQLGLVREVVAFPPHVEEFYLAYEKKEFERFRTSSICGICGYRGADLLRIYPNLYIHESCPSTHGWYICEGCGWLYPSNKKPCNRKPECIGKKLVKHKPQWLK